MKYKKVYEILEHRRFHDAGFRYSDYSGWRSYNQTYVDRQHPLWIVAEDPSAGRRLWITQDGSHLSITIGPMDRHGHSYGHAIPIHCKNQSMLVNTLRKLLIMWKASAIQSNECS